MKSLSAHTEIRLLKMAGHIPVAVWWPLGQLASLVLAVRPPKPLRQWELNATIATGKSPGWRGRRAAQFSWLQNTIWSLQLGNWSERKILRSVRIPPEQLSHLQAMRAGRGVVIAAPHMGSWDLCGAFGTVTGLPVTSVAERLPAGQFEYFRDLRARLGMEIHPHDQPDALQLLLDALRSGRVISLVADRDFGGRGLPVCWPTPGGGRELTLPAGPAKLAQLTGASLFGLTSWFVGRRLHIAISDEISVRPGRDGLVEMAQELAEFFAAEIADKPAHWHMMQRFFPGEVA